MKSSIRCTPTRTSRCGSITNCAIGNTPTTACAPTSRSPTSLHWNSSPVGNSFGERPSVTNLLDEYTAVHRRACSFILGVAFRIAGMRILVLSDLHSNATALDAVLAAAEGRWDLSVCLGDVVGYGPDPNEVTARLRELGTQTIRGNHDKAV